MTGASGDGGGRRRRFEDGFDAWLRGDNHRARTAAETGRCPRVARVVEAVELAGVRAEEAVLPSRSRLPTSPLRGYSAVMVDFSDPDLLASFHAAGAIIRSFADPAESWDIVRRWESAGGDALLDEDMGLVVASSLNEEFAGGLSARVFTRIDRQ